jgi:TPR repeat protein
MGAMHLRLRLRLALAALAALALAACGAASSQPPADATAGATASARPCNATTAEACRVACEGGDAACCDKCADPGMRDRTLDPKRELASRDPAADQELARAVAQNAEACEGGGADACTAAGEAFAEGRGVKQDDARAASLFRRGCERGARSACLELGVFRAQGRGGPRVEGESTTLLRKACEEDDETSLACRLFAAKPADRARMRETSRRKIAECNLLIEAFSAKMDALGQVPRKGAASDLRGMADAMDRAAEHTARLPLTLPELTRQNAEYQEMARGVAKAARALATAWDKNDRAAIKAAQAELDKAVKREDPIIDAINKTCQAP